MASRKTRDLKTGGDQGYGVYQNCPFREQPGHLEFLMKFLVAYKEYLAAKAETWRRRGKR